MVTFLPFPGFRPALKDGDKISDRISPPYDVIGDDYLKDLQSRPFNVTNLTLKPDSNKRYAESRKILDSWVEEGSLKQDTDSFYLYEQTFDDNGTEKIRTGIVGILKTENYDQGNIIPHEETFSKVKEDRLNLLRDMETHLESIFGIFEGFSEDTTKEIKNSAKLVYRFEDEDGVEHRYLRIDSADLCAKMTEELKDQKMLIADGHHRYETALNYSLENPDDEKKGYVLATLVADNDPGLVIWPTHRLIDAESISEKNAITKIQAAMETEEVSLEELEQKLPEWEMGFIFKSGKCLLGRYDGKEDPIWSLDTYVAQELIMKGIYKSDDGKSKISYDAELSSVKDKMAEKKHDVAIVLNDPSLKTIWDLSMIGKRMPKKTTYFFPKIWSGWVFYRMS